jgi:hypothetical protein
VGELGIVSPEFQGVLGIQAVAATPIQMQQMAGCLKVVTP